MRGLIVLAHPNEGSFNHAVANRVMERLRADGHEIDFHDLYREQFNPMVRAEDMAREMPGDVTTYSDQLVAADVLVFIHPSWWGQPPAILKGWVDRVFRAGSAYRFVDQGGGVGAPEGLLKADRAIVLNTANSNPTQWGGTDPLEEWWRNTVLGMCGVKHVARRLFAPIIVSTDEQRMTWMQEAEDLAHEMFAAQQIIT